MRGFSVNGELLEGKVHVLRERPAIFFASCPSDNVLGECCVLGGRIDEAREFFVRGSILVWQRIITQAVIHCCPMRDA